MTLEKQIKRKAFKLIKDGIFPVEKIPRKDSLQRESSFIVKGDEFIFNEEDIYEFPSYPEEKKINYAIAYSLRFIDIIPIWIKEFDHVDLPDEKKILAKIPEDSEVYHDTNEKDKFYFNDEFISAKEFVNKKFELINKPFLIDFKYINLRVIPVICSNQRSEESLLGNMLIQDSYWISWKIKEFNLKEIKQNYNDYIINRLQAYYEFLINKINKKNTS